MTQENLRVTFFVYFWPMKKLLIFVTILLSVQLYAQDTVLLQRIKEANMEVATFQSNITRHLVTSSDITDRNGELQFMAPDKLCTEFDNGTYLIINNNRIKLDIGYFHGTFKIRKKGLMRSFANLFLYAFQGRCQDLAEENNYFIETQTDENFHIVTLTTKKKSFLGLGYKTAVFHFGLDDLLIKELILTDYRDTHDTYRLLAPVINGNMDENKFSL